MRALGTNSEEDSVCELVGYAQEQYFRVKETFGTNSFVWELKGTTNRATEPFGANSDVWGLKGSGQEQYFRVKETFGTNSFVWELKGTTNRATEAFGANGEDTGKGETRRNPHR